jgi:hypothetical protein
VLENRARSSAALSRSDGAKRQAEGILKHLARAAFLAGACHNASAAYARI